jgi:hypothetical protein
MTLELKKAIITRWADAGLNSSLGKLYPAGGDKSTSEILQDVVRSREVFGAEPEKVMPRFEYVALMPDSEYVTPMSQAHTSNFRIHLYETSDLSVGNDMRTIRSAFNRAQEATVTNRMKFTNGDKLIKVTYTGATSHRVGHNVHMGVVNFFVRWLESALAPS